MPEYKQVWIPVCPSDLTMGPNIDDEMGDAYLDREKAKSVLQDMVEQQWGEQALWEDEHWIHRGQNEQGITTWIGWLEQRNLDEELLE